MRLTWLPDILKSAGLTVHEYSGREHDGKTWSTRGSDDWGPIRGITIHETRGSKTSTDAGELRVLVKGSSSAPPPIAQMYLSRTGEWWVVASGRCNHNLTGWDGPNEGYGNSRLIGIEAQHALGEPWTDRQYRSYVRGVAALVRKLGVPVSRVAGHKEHQPGSKTDPSFDMDQFRRDVAAVLAGEDDDMPTVSEIWGAQFGPRDARITAGQMLAEARTSAATAVAQVTALRSVVETLAETIRAGGGSVDTAAILRGVDERVAKAESEIRDAVADLGEGGAGQVRGPQG